MVSLRSGAGLLVCLDSAAGRRASGSGILDTAAGLVGVKTADSGATNGGCLSSGDDLGASEDDFLCWSAATDF